MQARCLSIAQVMARLGISRTTAYQLAHTKGFPVVRIGDSGRRIVVPEKALMNWLRERVAENAEAE